MKRNICLVVTLLSLFCLPPAGADEATSLSLLVETLQTHEDTTLRNSLMKGMLSGLAGRRNVPAPEGWEILNEELSLSDDETTRELSMQLSQVFGDPAALRHALSQVTDASVEPSARRSALRSLLTQQYEAASEVLESLLDDPEIQLDAIRGYATIENATAPGILLRRYSEFGETQRRAVIETLATRKRYARALLSAITEGAIPRDDIPAHVARSMNLILGETFSKAFGEVRDLSEDRTKLMAKYKAMCTPQAIAKADASRGRAVFEKTCASCHVLYGTGGKIGPDLTGSNRANLDYILLNSVDPSYDVPEGYKMVLIQTVDGRLLNGVVAEEDEVRVVLKTVEQPEVIIQKDDIEARKISEKSMMPDGQLEQMKPQEVIDLVKYLRTTQQVEKAQ